jgi:hypothetical protein
MAQVLRLIHKPTGKRCALFVVSEKLRLAHSREMQNTCQFYCDDLNAKADVFADEFQLEVSEEMTPTPESANTQEKK